MKHFIKKLKSHLFKPKSIESYIIEYRNMNKIELKLQYQKIKVELELLSMRLETDVKSLPAIGLSIASLVISTISTIFMSMANALTQMMNLFYNDLMKKLQNKVTPESSASKAQIIARSDVLLYFNIFSLIYFILISILIILIITYYFVKKRHERQFKTLKYKVLALESLLTTKDAPPISKLP
ncbi:hypothetical protein FY534_13820 (plasmid) [Alicyclobacillus sp. TC]|uniref:Uncharacterized protein n=1 Tax=Alicyclobacillus tolerans TaxID=90970 RepID=A0ABT9LYL2_9BACL|nr:MULTISPECIES: hypothetical protein [Alicyclobacillus]MDP9729355.1 hypothetical protein [Alicyclobacillus tengchongensis]QRF24854.1 hypothetical protein FY534_13820 [Alicyclobacillus sp. TC]